MKKIQLTLVAFFVIMSGGFAIFATAHHDNAKQGEQIVTDGNLSSTMNEAITSITESAKNLVSDDSAAPALVQAARQQIGITVTYDPAYVSLDFPMGDVPIKTGVCTDVVVRAYRELGKDLQLLVNQDMKKAWSQYPKIWGLKGTDKNIDHRRVPNLRVFFRRHGKSLPVEAGTSDASKFKAGDIVTWKVAGRPHIGIVSNRTTYKKVPLIIHNIGRGTREDDILFRYPITGHYRYG